MRQGPLNMVIERPEKHIGKKCHVQGWNLACQFVLKGSDGIKHDLETPKTGRRFQATNKLLYTRGEMESILAEREA